MFKNWKFFSFFLAISSSGCIGITEKKCPVNIPSTEKIQYFGIAPGSYFIYKDSVSGVEDSLYVQVATNTIYPNYCQKFQDHNFPYIIGFELSCPPGSPLFRDMINSNPDSNNNVRNRKFYLFENAMKIMEVPYSFETPTTQFQINGTSYKKVKVLRTETLDNLEIVFLDEEYAMVKLVVGRGNLYKVWELERSHIVR